HPRESIAPGAEGPARGRLSPYFLAIAVQLDDDVAVGIGRQRVPVGQACGVRRVCRGCLPEDLALPVDFDDLIRAVLGDEQVAVGEPLTTNGGGVGAVGPEDFALAVAFTDAVALVLGDENAATGQDAGVDGPAETGVDLPQRFAVAAALPDAAHAVASGAVML